MNNKRKNFDKRKSHTLANIVRVFSCVDTVAQLTTHKKFANNWIECEKKKIAKYLYACAVPVSIHHAHLSYGCAWKLSDWHFWNMPTWRAKINFAENFPNFRLCNQFSIRHTSFISELHMAKVDRIVLC